MQKHIVVVKQGAADELKVMGAGVKFLCTGDKTGRAWSLMETTLPKRAGPPPHRHAWDEAYYVTAGRVRFFLEGREELFEAGDFVYAPANTLHGFQGDSEEPARVLIFDAPAHTEGFFRECEREVRELPQDLGKALAIGAKHGIQFVRPQS